MFDLPYNAQSPVSLKRKRYETKKDIIDEVEMLIEQAIERHYKIGQSLFLQLPFFCNPSNIISDWCWEMITDYFLVKRFNVPLANNLEDANPWKVDCFSIIESEISNIAKYERENNGN